MQKRFLVFCLIIVTALSSALLISCKKEQAVNGYDIKIEYTENEIIGTEDVFFYNDTENSFTELKFNLYANAFRKDATIKPINPQQNHQAYYLGESYGNIEIRSCRSNLEPLEFCIKGEDKNILVVTLKEEIFPNESVSVSISYVIKLANVIARTGVNEKTVNLANFYPILCAIDENGFYECLYYSKGDPYYSNYADYSVEVTAPSEYVVASSGELLSSQTTNGKTVNTYSLRCARSFALVLGKDLKTLEADCDGVQVKYYYFDDQTPDKSLQTAVESLRYFEKTFGEYIYNTYSVVQTKFMQGGMEFPALVMISDEIEGDSYHEVIIHETAHQWWAIGVGNNEIEYAFLDEGLTEYSVVMFYENHADYGYSREQLMNISETTYKTYCSVHEKLFGNVDTSMVRSLKDFKSEYEYVNLAYVKSCIMYDNLRDFVGDENFYKCLKKYYSKYCYANAMPQDLIGVFEDCNSNVEGFFDSFLNGKVIL